MFGSFGMPELIIILVIALIIIFGIISGRWPAGAGGTLFWDYSEVTQQVVWQILADERNGVFVEGRNKVIVALENGTVTLRLQGDTKGEGGLWTHLEAPCAAFPFTVNHDTFVGGPATTLGRLWGMRPISVGDPEFEGRIIIRGKNESRVRALFANPKIRELILAQERLFFRGTRKGLFWSEDGQIDDLSRLHSILDLFDETLRQLP